MNSPLQQVLERPDVWRPRDRRRPARARCQSTGFTELDRELHGGWPPGALIELMLRQAGIGELFLLTSLLAELSRTHRLNVWINPPFIPYAPALAQRGIALESLLIVRGKPQHHLWACEQALRNAACGAVLYWPADQLRYAELRKLQVAAATQNAMGFLFRDQRAAQQTSPAALRLQLDFFETQLSIHIIKHRGYAAGQNLLLPREEFLSPKKSLHSARSSTFLRPAQRIAKIAALDRPIVQTPILVQTPIQLSSSAAAPF